MSGAKSSHEAELEKQIREYEKFVFDKGVEMAQILAKHEEETLNLKRQLVRCHEEITRLTGALIEYEGMG